MNDQYTPTIGVEIHCQLSTKSKMFCACDNDSRGAEPNTNVCPICLGFPGTLPSLNQAAAEFAIKLGLGLNAQIAEYTKFDRKNYFYPDLPKGYQISQYDLPIVHDGSVEILVDGEFIKIGVERAHMEEDAAKLIHPPGADYSLVDYNRGGTPLLEIVSKPELHSPAAARRYLQEVYNIAMALGITHGNMEEGNFKFDLNVSVSADANQLGSKVELKNLNSFRNAERALSFEIKRQIERLEAGEVITQETRGWDDAKSVTFSQRSKEEANDYRYFPEPDLPPLVITAKMIDEIRATLPPLPIEVRKRLIGLNVGIDDQDLLIGQPQTLQIFDEAAEILQKTELVKKAINWLAGDYQALLKSQNLNPVDKKSGEKVSYGENVELTDVSTRLTGANLAKLVQLVDRGAISSKTAKEIFPEVVAGQIPEVLIEKHGHVQISDESELQAIVQKVVAANPQAKTDFQAGKTNAHSFLVGQIMKETRGQANPAKVNELLRAELEKA